MVADTTLVAILLPRNHPEYNWNISRVIVCGSLRRYTAQLRLTLKKLISDTVHGRVA